MTETVADIFSWTRGTLVVLDPTVPALQRSWHRYSRHPVGDDFILSDEKIGFRDSFSIPRRCRSMKWHFCLANGDNLCLFYGGAQPLRACLDPYIIDVTSARRG